MNKICRICLEEGVLSSVFTKNYSISLCDMIEYCCNIKVKIKHSIIYLLCSNLPPILKSYKNIYR